MYLLSLFSISPLDALIFIAGLVAAVTVHEFAHAWTAYHLGDDTPYLQGRVTLNPAAHLDPMGSLVFLIIGMGWGRPVQYNPMRLSRRVDELLVALAGPASNLLFALLLNLVSFAAGPYLPGYAPVLHIVSSLNVALAAFNMIPIPPLDGSAIIAYFWPEYRSMVGGQVGLIILLALIFLPIGGGNLLSALTVPVRAIFGSLVTLGGIIG